MNKITSTFNYIKSDKRIAFMPFLVAGYPTFANSVSIAKILCKHADLLEIGFPYSDPLADGPTIQTATQLALQNGMNPDKVFEFIKTVRTFSNIPITILVYANLVMQRGINTFYKDARDAGVDGILIPDAPVEESTLFVETARKYNINQIFLVSQTTAPDRLKKILKSASGFLYLVSTLGVTGVRNQLSQDIPKLIGRIKKQTQLPVALGFGISTKEQVTALRKTQIDGFIIGSALIDIISNCPPSQYQERLNKYLTKII
jgi:tryptophan synthase alpha chain